LREGIRGKIIGNFFSFILFIDEKENSGKGLSLGPLGCKGDSNY